jgi:sugar phosphate isomerase/epimerase
MRIGIHLSTFRRPSFEEALDAAVEQELDCLHVNFAIPGLQPLCERYDAGLVDRLATATAERKLPIVSLSGTFNMIHPDRRERQAGLGRLELVAVAAGKLGRPLISLCTGTRDPDDMWRAHPENTSTAAWNDLYDSMDRALQIASRYDVTLGIEPETGNVIQTAGAARQLLAELNSPRLKIIFDPANLFHHDELYRMLRSPNMRQLMRNRIEPAIDLLGPDIALAHAKEVGPDGLPGGLGPGTGKMDWAYIITALKRAGFDGPVILHDLPEGDIEDAVDHLDQWI